MTSSSELPTGSVTFLFTDIEGSTRLMTDLGSEYDDLLDQHHELLRSAWREHGGAEVNTEGDAFFVAFADPDRAVAAAAHGQRLLSEATWPGAASVKVRMGLHRGFARPRNDDYVALAVNQAARVVGAAHGGQVLLSEHVLDAMEAAPETEELGHFRLRDFPSAVALHRLRPDGWKGDERAPRARPVDGHNLVRPVTGMVDRIEQVEWLGREVRPGSAVTIVGPGGVGKTRLATEHALAALSAWRDGVWLVELESAGTIDQVANAIAEALGAAQEPGIPAMDDVRRHLEQAEVLVLLDNAEQALEAVARAVSEIQLSCPGVAVLTTSRAPLGLRGERILRLDPLVTTGVEPPAVQLFLDRCTPGMELDQGAVRSLCERLDGLPLAIELTAVRTSAMTPSAILDLLDSSPWLVSGRDPSLPERHRSLEKVLDWSWELLSPAQAALFGRLAQFAKGFDLPLARIACSGGVVEEADVPELLWSLVDQSLVVADSASGGSRFRLLSSVRSHAAQRCPQEDASRVVSALAAHYLEHLGPDRATQHAWVSEMAVELANVRGVVVALAERDQPTAQALAWTIGRHLEITGSYHSAVREIQEALVRLPEPSANRVALQAQLADVWLRMGEIESAERVLDEAARAEREVGLPDWHRAGILRPRGEIALRRREYALAEAVGRELLVGAEEPRTLTRAWNLVGLAAAMSGQHQLAAEAFRNELAAAEAAGLETFLANTHTNLAETYLELGDVASGARHQHACLELARASGEQLVVAYSVLVAARLLGDQGEVARAVALHESGMAALADMGHQLYETDADRAEAFLHDARRQLGGDGLERAIAHGRSLSLNDAADEASMVLYASQRGGVVA